jgi:prefoldin subunit 5
MKVGLCKFIVATLFLLSACQPGDTNESKNLERQLDSVNQELEVTRQELMDSKQVKALLDSIDASRKVTISPIGADNDQQRNISRLNDLNEYVKDINMKMDQMEKSIKYVNSMAASILKLQADIEARTQQIAMLEAESKKQATSHNISTSRIIQRKDSTLAMFIKNCQQDIAILQKTMEEVHAKNNEATAALYFKQAEALAAMAQNVSPSSKRKIVKREALEMYKISYSLGKKDAQQKISMLEADL